MQVKKLLEPVCCMSNNFSFPQQLYRFNLGAKNGWNLFVACQIFSVFRSSSTDSTWGTKNCWNLFVACPASFQSLQSCRFPCCAGFLLLWGVLGAAVAGPSQSLSCMAEKSIYIYISLSPSLAPSFPPSSLRPSLPIRIYYMLVEPAQSKCTWIPLFWQHNVGIDRCIFQFFSRPFFNDNECLPKLPPGCQNTGEGSCNRPTIFQ